LLLAGQTGSGKTTLAKLLVKNLECDYIFINASDENGVETIRTKIKAFASSASFKPLKVIILDESDYLTPAAQHTLRAVIEIFSKSTRFIFTCNHRERLIPEIHSRCTPIDLEPPAKHNIASFIANILDSEKVEYEPVDIVEIVNKLYPDTRATINAIQSNSTTGKLIVPKIFATGYQNDIIKILKGKQVKKDAWKEIRQIIVDNDVRDFESIFRKIYDNFLENPEIICTVGEWQAKHTFAPDKEINFMTCIYKILEIK
jgi:replication factor C small subunit